MGLQLLLPTLVTTILSVSGRPSLTELSEGSERISERLSWPSTKYGPMVNSGRTTQSRAALVVDGACVDPAAAVGFSVGNTVLVAVGAAHEARNATPPNPINLSASLRLRSCPTGLSSFSMLIISLSLNL